MQDIPDKIHFIGIGGAGMSGLARVLLDLGLDVRGSDINSTPVTERLKARGAPYTRGTKVPMSVMPNWWYIQQL